MLRRDIHLTSLPGIAAIIRLFVVVVEEGISLAEGLTRIL